MDESEYNPPTSPNAGLDDPTLYRTFLAALQSGELSALDDENDADYQEEEEEQKKLTDVFDSWEYRNDRAVHVSQKEIEELLQEYEGDFPVEMLSSEGTTTRRTRLVICLINFNNKQYDRRRSSPRPIPELLNEDSNDVSPMALKPIRPNYNDSQYANGEPNISKSLFTKEQLQQLNSQLRDHTQLLIQVC
jgi:hypothetical protein